MSCKFKKKSALPIKPEFVLVHDSHITAPKSCVCTGHQHRHLANVAGQAEVGLIQRAWGHWMASPEIKILADRKGTSFMQDHGMDEAGVSGYLDE